MSRRKDPESSAQALMETNLMARMYESLLWRRNPLLVFLLGINANQEYKIISRAMNLTGRETILDIACGPGIFTRRFASEATQGHVFGMDLSWPMLKQGQRLVRQYRLSNIDLLQGNALALPFANHHFDAANCAAALHLFDDLTATFSEVSRVLKPGGQFTFSTFRAPKDKLISSYLRLRQETTGIRSFKQQEIEAELQKAGFTEIHSLHAKGIWVVMSARTPSVPASGITPPHTPAKIR
jgi:SAM-dependent methyltransferase